jgi:hypothetical protein
MMSSDKRGPTQRNLIVSPRGRWSRGGIAGESWRYICDSEVMISQDRLSYERSEWRRRTLIDDPLIAAAAALNAKLKAEDSYD